MAFIAQHVMLTRMLAALCAAAAVLIALSATRQRPRHRGHGRSTSVGYVPRRGPRTPRYARYAPRHEIAQGGPVVLGNLVDGDITLVHAAQPAEPAAEIRADDERTVDVPALAGAA